MSIKPLQTLNDFTPAQRFVKNLAGKGLAPLLLLEVSVTGGRTYQAYKRGGKTEAREVFVDNIVGAAFWLGGVKAFNKIIDKIGEKALNVASLDVDTAKDALRDPVKHFLKNNTNITEKQLGLFKCTKMAASILLANALMGFVVPRINQGITAKKVAEARPREPLMAKFIERTENRDAAMSGAGQALSFAGTADLMNLVNFFENSTRFQLLATDAGVTAGRVCNERNGPSRIEKLFRDVGSTYFYMFNVPLMYKGLNKLFDGRVSRLDPVAAQQTASQLEKMLAGGKLSAVEFEKSAAGALGQEEFLTNVYNLATGGKYADPNKFVAQQTLRGIDENIGHFVKDVVKKADGGDITAGVIKSVQKQNFVKNMAYLGAGFAVSMFVLSTVIPKMQYAITKKLTGRDKFPGIEDYSKDKNCR